MLKGKRVLLGVCGSIAAYKAALLVRLLIKEGAEVKVVMTASAREFITPLTLSTLSRNPVLSEFKKDDTGEWNNHVELGMWADVMVIAPASAHTIAKMSQGLCDNLLTAVYLSARCPVAVAPAMDLDMYAHPSTQNNLKSLASYGNIIIDPEHGELASGLVGNGRMAEPEEILAKLNGLLKKKSPLTDFYEGKHVLITAGPTHEAIDPVRFIGNHSSGKMGIALAEACSELGAKVTLVCGPTSEQTSHTSVSVVNVTSADEMYEAAAHTFKHAHIAILAAAVADFKPAATVKQKIKKKENGMQLNLVRTTDIAAELGKLKTADQVLVGFALETENEETNAREKLRRKNFDLIVLNSLNDEGAGFAHDTNRITIFDRMGSSKTYSLKSKPEVAADILEAIVNFKA